MALFDIALSICCFEADSEDDVLAIISATLDASPLYQYGIEMLEEVEE